MTELIRVLIADDHPVVRQGLRGMLIPRNGIEIVGEATNGREAVELARELEPDVIVMDLVMPELKGSEATALIRQNNPEARILILTSFGEIVELAHALQAGALGCLLKDSHTDDLLHAIRSVNRGHLAIPKTLAPVLMNQPGSPKTGHLHLTDREQEIVALVALGMSNKEIAERLNLSAHTVRSHVSSVLKKLGLTNRTQVAVYLKSDPDA